MDAHERKKWLQVKAVTFFKQGRLRINDPGSVYSVQDNAMKCITPGEYATQLQTTLRKVKAGKQMLAEADCV